MILDTDLFTIMAHGDVPHADIVVVNRSELAALYESSGLGDRRSRRDPSDAAVIIWTSGTTGIPKGAWFDHRNLHAAVASAGVMSNPYAMTESPSITGTDRDDDPMVQCRTVGRPQAGMEIELVDDDGALVPQGEVGRVRIRPRHPIGS